MTRNELKDIVKECLVEIMMEGLEPQKKKEISEAPVRRTEQKQVKKHHLDNVSYNPPQKIEEKVQKRQVSSELIDSFPKDQRGIMNDIFEDTVKTTLRSQITAEKNIKAGMDPTTTSGVDPMKVFEGASNWADLAFSSTKQK